MKKIEKFGVRKYDPYDNDEIVDRFLDVADKLNELIDRVNQLSKEEK